MKIEPLRYSIDSWYDLPKCKSNNSKDLKIYVEDILDENKLTGLVISIHHKKYGILFSHMINCYGELVNANVDDRPHEFSYSEILKELEKFGFLIEFTPQLHLPDLMIEYLYTLQGLHYDKLRVISITDKSKYILDSLSKVHYVVAFSPDKLPKWLDNRYSPTTTEFTDALVSGAACNVSMSPEGKKLNWSWLDYVANISDLLQPEMSE